MRSAHAVEGGSILSHFSVKNPCPASKLWFTANTSQPSGSGWGGALDRAGALRVRADNPGWLDYPTMVFGTTFRTRDTLYLSIGATINSQNRADSKHNRH